MFLTSGTWIYGQIFSGVSSDNGPDVTFELKQPSTIYLDSIPQIWEEDKDHSLEDRMEWMVVKEKHTGGFIAMGNQLLYSASHVNKDGLFAIDLRAINLEGTEVGQYTLSDSVNVRVHTITTYNDDIFLVYQREFKRGKYEINVARFDRDFKLLWQTSIGEYKVSIHKKGDRLKVDKDRIILLTKKFGQLTFVIMDHSGTVSDYVTMSNEDNISTPDFLINRDGHFVLFGLRRILDPGFTKSWTRSFIIELNDDYSVKNHISLASKWEDEYIMSVEPSDLVQDERDGSYYFIGKHTRTTVVNSNLFFPIKRNYIGRMTESFQEISIEQIKSKTTDAKAILRIVDDGLLFSEEGLYKADSKRDLHLHFFNFDLQYQKTLTALAHHKGITNICQLSSSDSILIGGGSGDHWMANVHLDD